MTSVSETAAPFLVGPTLSRTWEILTKAFSKLFVLALIPLLPLFALNFYTGALPGQLPTGVGGFSIFVAFVLYFVLDMVAKATILYGSFQEMKGQEFSIGESLSIGLNRLFPLIGVSILVALVIGLGMVLLVVPGFIALSMLYVAVPVCVIEKPGVTECLSRSSYLTKGYRWQIFGLVVLVAIVAAIFGGLMKWIGLLTGSLVVLQILSFLVQVLVTTYSAVLSAVVYRDLRMAKEGVDTSKIANIFS